MSFKNKTTGLLTLLILYISSCAHQSSPTGGPKDEEPPVLELSTPPDKTINYSDQTVILEFDEYINLKNPKEQIIITPRLLGEYEINHKKNKVTIKFEEPLLDSTTYTLNFREAIQDLNEGNSPPDLQLAFSTGDYLDSLSISGNVHYLLNYKPADKITISLYDAHDTLDIFNSPPVYFTKSNSSGEFTFNNLKYGLYKINAINDKNKNLILESENESYAYLDRNIQLDSNITQLKLPLVNVDVNPLQLQSSRTRGHYFVVKYNKYISSYTLRSMSSNHLTPETSFSEDHREIKYYNPHTISDSLGLIISAYDTINKVSVDTVFVKFEETKREKDDFNTTYSKIFISTLSPLLEAGISFTKPVLSHNFDSIYLHVDSTRQILFDTTHFEWNKHRTFLTIRSQLDPTIFQITPPTTDSVNTTSEILPQPSRKVDKPILYFGEVAFLSIEQDSSINHSEEVSFINQTSTGLIFIQVETKFKSFYVQLLNNSDRIVAEKYNEKSFSFNNIPPGTYQIRILVDTNQNQQWDIGDITENIAPEPVIFYTSEENSADITVRANWELGPIILKF